MDSKTKNTLKKVAIIGSTSLLATGAIVGGALVVLPLVGFGATGVVAGSIAALWQSSIGSVAAGSAFAALQSAGVAGLAGSTVAAIGAASTGVATAATLIVDHATKSEKKKADKQTQTGIDNSDDGHDDPEGKGEKDALTQTSEREEDILVPKHESETEKDAFDPTTESGEKKDVSTQTDESGVEEDASTTTLGTRIMKPD